MSILITGAAGFIGSNLVDYLLQKSHSSIVAVDNFNAYYNPELKRKNTRSFSLNDRVKLIEGDFCKAEFCHSLFEQHRIENIVHLGGYAGVRNSIKNPHIYQQTNVTGTLNLFQAAKQHQVNRFILASSSTVYGQGAQAPFVEDAYLGVPLSPYGASKQAAEVLAQTYHLLEQIPTVTLRLFSVYGPRLRPDLAMSIFTQRVLSKQPITLFGNGEIERDFTHINDICDGIGLALNTPEIDGQTFNLGQGNPITIKTLIELIEQASGIKAIVEKQPRQKGDMQITHACLGKAKSVLGYQPKINIEDGVHEFVAWFKANRLNASSNE